MQYFDTLTEEMEKTLNPEELAELEDKQLSEICRQIDEILSMRYPGMNIGERWGQVSITLQLSSRMRAGSEPHPNYLNKVIRVLNDLDLEVRFLPEKNSIQPYFVVEKAEKPVSLIDDWAQEEGKGIIHFLYYYVGNAPTIDFTLNKAHCAINRSTTPHLVNLIIYPREYLEADRLPPDVKHDRSSPSVVYKGKILYTPEHAFLQFESRQSRGMRATEQPSLTCLQATEEQLGYKNLIVCAFISNGPAAGVSVLEKSSLAHIRKALNDTRVPPPIGSLLVGKRFSLKDYQAALFDIKRHEELVREVKRFEGVYLGFVVTNNNNGQEIGQFGLEIHDGHRIRYFSIRKRSEMMGYILQINGNRIIARGNYDYSTDLFRTIINLKTDVAGDLNDFPDGTLSGIYGGIKYSNYSPTSGRILLIPCSAETRLEDVPVGKIPIRPTSEFHQLIEEYPYLIPFFAGKLDSYTDSFLSNKDSEAVRLFSKYEAKEEINQVDKYAGFYISLRLSTSKNEHKVYQRPFWIRPESNEVRRYYRLDDNGREVIAYGKARLVYDLLLSLEFGRLVTIDRQGKQVYRPYSRFSHIYVSRVRWGGRDYVDGQTISTNRDIKAISYREFYRKADPGEINVENVQDYVQTWTRDHLPDNAVDRKMVLTLLNGSEENYTMVSNGRGS